MAVINIRVDDHIHDALKATADNEGITLSEFVRVLLREAVEPAHVDREVQPGDEPAPEALRFMDRKVLSMLHRIMARVLPEGANGTDGTPEDHLDLAHALEEGFTGEYWRETAGFSTELSKSDSRRVFDILDMFRVISFSISTLTKNGAPVEGRGLEFRGFDHNDALEGHMASYVDHLVDHDRWSELRDTITKHDAGNSHMPMLDIYSRMLAEYRRIMHSGERRYSDNEYLLSIDELTAISNARTHPSHRTSVPTNAN